MLGFSSEQSSLGYKTEQGFKAPFPNDAITGSFDGSKVTAGTNTVTETDSLINYYLHLVVCSIIMMNVICFRVVCVLMEVLFSELIINGVYSLQYPVVGLVSNEKFFKNWDQKWWNTLKIRASYGVTGNNSISNTAAYATLTSSGNLWGSCRLLY